jgi:hypothetical protein
MLSGKQGADMDFAAMSDVDLHEELDAMRVALKVSQSSEAEARLRQKIAAAEKELEKRNAHRT